MQLNSNWFTIRLSYVYSKSAASMISSTLRLCDAVQCTVFKFFFFYLQGTKWSILVSFVPTYLISCCYRAQLVYNQNHWRKRSGGAIYRPLLHLGVSTHPGRLTVRYLYNLKARVAVPLHQSIGCTCHRKLMTDPRSPLLRTATGLSASNLICPLSPE